MFNSKRFDLYGSQISERVKIKVQDQKIIEFDIQKAAAKSFRNMGNHPSARAHLQSTSTEERILETFSELFGTVPAVEPIILENIHILLMKHLSEESRKGQGKKEKKRKKSQKKKTPQKSNSETHSYTTTLDFAEVFFRYLT